jgi:hypothetical protein
VLAGKSAEIVSEGGARFKVDDLGVFLDIVAASALDDESGFMIEMMAGGDIRRGLQLVREFLASGHTSADHALSTYLTQGEFKFPKHEIFRGAVLGQRKYYREEESLLPNIFDAKLDSAHLQLLRLHVIGWFVAKSQTGLVEAVSADVVIDQLHRVGIAETDVNSVLATLSEFRVLRSADGLPYSPSSRVMPTRFASYLLRELAPSFAYVELCLMDTAVFDDDTWHHMVLQTRQIQISQRYERVPIRLERAQTFIQYLLKLEERWVVECRRRGLDESWSSQILLKEVKPALEADLVRVLKSADWQYYKKVGLSLPGMG